MKRRAFVQVPVALARDHSLSYAARQLWVVIRSYGDADGEKCFPGVETLARDMGCDRKSVFRWIKELEDAGYLFKASGRSARRHGEFMTNTYTLLETPAPRPKIHEAKKPIQEKDAA